MKEKIKNFAKSNFYNIVVILAILGAFLTVVLKEGWLTILFFLGALFFLAIVWFFSQDKQIKEFKEIFNKKFPFLGKTIAIIFRIFVFLIFLFSIFIITAGIIDTFKERSAIKTQKAEQEKFHNAEIAYQKCLDKVASLTVREPYTEYFLGQQMKFTKNKNQYFNEWTESGRPNYVQNRGHWEWAFVEWMMQKYPEFCSEYNTDLINYFLKKEGVIIWNPELPM